MLFIYTIIYFISVLLYYKNLNIIASCLMIALAIFLFVASIKKSKKIINTEGLFVLGFIGGFGLSLLKLSNLSMEYSITTFLAVYISYFSLSVGVFCANRKKIECSEPLSNRFLQNLFCEKMKNKNIIIWIIMIISFLSFLIEAMFLGFVPLFIKDTPHAYSTFHIFGLHYITTLYIFVPSIAICNYYCDNKMIMKGNCTNSFDVSIENKLMNGNNVKKKSLSIWMIIISFMYVVVMSLLMVTRGKLIISIVIAIFTYIIFNQNSLLSNFKCVKIKKNELFVVLLKKILFAIGMFVLFVVVYFLITVFRAHNIEYLNSIFDMKNKNMPIFITQPYMYITQNFENLNYMIEKTFRLTFGRRMLYPYFTLTLIKKFFPIAVESPNYFIKEELSTVTLIYDAYYDFGLVGVALFCFVLGYIGAKIENISIKMVDSNNMSIKTNSNYFIILNALFSYYMLFSFFQAYFSVTDTWVGIGFVLLISLL